MIIRRQAKSTLTAVEMFHGDTLEFRLCNGSVCKLTLESTAANIVSTTLKKLGKVEPLGKTIYQFQAHFRIGQNAVTLEREVGSQRSFYEPWVIDGVRIWLDAVDAIFDLEGISEAHGPCRSASDCSWKQPLQAGAPWRPPQRPHARLALQDATQRICPEILHPWCPLPKGGLRIEDCFHGDCCWLGACGGTAAHAGLDVNHPKGTPLWAPIDIQDHFFFKSVEMGYSTNGWRGIHRWPDGSEWILQAHHSAALMIPEHAPIRKGQQFTSCDGAVRSGVDHTHFGFKIHDLGETFFLDPWILFWQMYQDQKGKRTGA